MENTIDEKESLRIIREMIASTKTNYQENSTHYLLWGYVVMICCLVEYFMITQGQSPYHWVVWPVAMPITGLTAWLIGARQSKTAEVKTYIESAIGYLWTGIVVMIFMALFLSVSIGWTNSFILLTSIYGLGTFVSGGILRFKPLMVGGVLAWAITMILLFGGPVFRQFENAVLMLCASIIVSYLVPGHMLRNQKS